MIGSEIHIEGVSKQFGDFQALSGASFTIKQGEFFSLLGPSGCGKTTLLRILAGFEDPSAGIVYLDGKNILGLPPNQRSTNTVFQNYALFPHLTAFENIAFPLRLKKLPKKEIKKRVFEYLDLVQLRGQENKKPHQMSGGQKQRVSIARALINEPKVLLLDEPLSALDAKLRQQLLIDLDLIHDQVGITFVYVTHDQSEALSVSDRVAVMNKGSILQIGSPIEIYESPADSFVAEFIGENNFLEGKITAIDGRMVTVDTDGMGPIKVTSERPFALGDRVRHSIRPEKIRIQTTVTSKDPANNIIKGKVFEVIYTGFQSKFFVNIDSGYRFKVVKQHVQYLEVGQDIKWDTEVSIWWNPEDGYIVEKLP